MTAVNEALATLMANPEGRVIGVNSMVAGGLGMAVPSRDVQSLLEGLGRLPEVA